VTERTAQLQEALRVKSEFLSRVSHELRTPMNHVLGFAQLLELDPDQLTAEQKESVSQILQSGRHLLTLINRLLAAAKDQAADLSFLNTTATDAARDLSRRADI
jgi:signal transduction histidine kinase